MYEVMKWVSLAMVWIVIGVLLFLSGRTMRIRRELENELRIWKARNKYAEETGDAESPD